MSKIKLKPCPFCGSSRVYSRPYGEYEDGKSRSVYYVHCGDCGCDGPTVSVRGKHDAIPKAARNASIDMWNWRAK